MKKILIVEDEKSLADAYRTILVTHGYHVEVAYNGEEALELINKSGFDLILLDLKMPRLNGLEMLKRLDSDAQRSKVVVFSNQDSQPDIDEAFRLGAKHYLLKSWASPQDLVKVVEQGLAS
jgi:CheY-like chemotaxis protein